MRVHERAGRVVDQIDGYKAFEPAALPPQPPLELSASGLLPKLSTADMAVGRLDGLARSLPGADLFLAMYVRQEALLSSQIEGTECTLDDVLAFELDEGARVPELDVGEVVSYVAALNRGIELLGQMPLCNRLICEVHAVLLRDGRGSEKCHGEFRRTQNWIGPADRTLSAATFVPPPVHVTEQAMSDLERYLHEDGVPVLLMAGLAHVQFETIHPFLDGNGRTGRLLLSLLLHERRVLGKPVLYLSAYLKHHRSRYFERLMAVREEGDWEGWVHFFLDAVIASAAVASRTVERVHDLREHDRAEISGSGGVANDLRLLDALYTQPLVNANWVVDNLGVTAATANKMLERLGTAGVLREITGKRRYRVYRYDRYIDVFQQSATAREADETIA